MIFPDITITVGDSTDRINTDSVEFISMLDNVVNKFIPTKHGCLFDVFEVEYKDVNIYCDNIACKGCYLSCDSGRDTTDDLDGYRVNYDFTKINNYITESKLKHLDL